VKVETAVSRPTRLFTLPVNVPETPHKTHYHQQSSDNELPEAQVFKKFLFKSAHGQTVLMLFREICLNQQEMALAQLPSGALLA
jgi:hypothetical protein